jgi:hypothetical protein
VLLSGATTQSARAEWVLDHVEAPGTGNITYTAGSAPGIAPVNVSESLSDHNMWGQAGSVAAPTGWSPQRVQATNEVDGKVRAVFKWQSFEDPEMPGGGQAPPEYVTFKIDAFCFAEASRDVNENTLPHDATGEVAEAKIMDVAGSPYPQTHSTRENASTTQYKTVAVDENGYAISPWVEIKATAKVGSNRYTTISMFEGETMEVPLTGTVGIGWQITFSDPYEKYVLISRAGAPTPKKKGEPGVTIDEASDEWVDVDGTGYGHTTYSYEAEELIPTLDPLTHWVDRMNAQSFQAARTGYWSSNTSWQWVPPDSSDTVSAHSQDMPKGTMNRPFSVLEQWDGTPTGTSQKIITYTATDNMDGFQARAKYILTLHDKYENKRNDTPATTVVRHRFDFSPKNWSSCESNAAEPLNVSWNVNWTGNATMNFFSSLGVAPETLVKWGIGVNFQATATLEVSAPGTAATTIPQGQRAYPYLEYDVTTYHYLIDQYSPAGKVINSARINAPGGINDGSWPHSEDKLTDVYPRWSDPVDINSTGEGE